MFATQNSKMARTEKRHGAALDPNTICTTLPTQLLSYILQFVGGHALGAVLCSNRYLRTVADHTIKHLRVFTWKAEYFDDPWHLLAFTRVLRLSRQLHYIQPLAYHPSNSRWLGSLIRKNRDTLKACHLLRREQDI